MALLSKFHLCLTLGVACLTELAEEAVLTLAHEMKAPLMCILIVLGNNNVIVITHLATMMV